MALLNAVVVLKHAPSVVWSRMDTSFAPHVCVVMWRIPSTGSLAAMVLLHVWPPQVRKCFSDNDWLKYEQRRAEADVAKANLSGLVYCFHCKHPWEADREMGIFTCFNKSCLKRTCLKCKGADHSPGPCRNSKKITCRCGQQMCYLCRKGIEGYDHFCPEDENEVIKAAKSAALEKLAGHHPDVLKRQIGPSEESGKRLRKRKGN
ncbi:hypothetical protein R1flu_008684 [Riccia fluitans]|uniref:RING-type domain-containing protein n=1 Tax=Riccia fluitans TaxID=41844 RepID=A0ABD1YFY3_9MARC